jgi:S-DNA-T family DNA segregation ATPase FtsK/SpoIIIE
MALAHLGIPAMNRAVKDGWQVEFATPPVRVNGRGYQTTFSLPMGVTPEMIADKRDVLARNLVRAPLEVWPTAAEHHRELERQDVPDHADRLIADESLRWKR